MRIDRMTSQNASWMDESRSATGRYEFGRCKILSKSLERQKFISYTQTPIHRTYDILIMAWRSTAEVVTSQPWTRRHEKYEPQGAEGLRLQYDGKLERELTALLFWWARGLLLKFPSVVDILQQRGRTGNAGWANIPEQEKFWNLGIGRYAMANFITF